jgi:hypothetical protein
MKPSLFLREDFIPPLLPYHYPYLLSIIPAMLLIFPGMVMILLLHPGCSLNGTSPVPSFCPSYTISISAWIKEQLIGVIACYILDPSTGSTNMQDANFQNAPSISLFGSLSSRKSKWEP